MNKIFELLAEPFALKDLEWRVGSTNAEKTKGIALCYLNARATMNRLDAVMEPENWQDSYANIQGPGGTVGVVCSLSLKFNNEWVTKSDASDFSDIEAIKGGFSDAFKRACSKWGIGRYLYELPNVWVPIAPQGKSWKLAEYPILPAWALPTVTKTDKTPAGKPSEPVMVEIDEPKAPEVKKEEPVDIDAPPKFTKLLNAMLRDLVENKPQRKADSKANTLAHLLLLQAIPDETKRHTFCLEVFEAPSWSKVSPELVAAMLEWMNPTKFVVDDKTRYTLSEIILAQIEKAISE